MCDEALYNELLCYKSKGVGYLIFACRIRATFSCALCLPTPTIATVAYLRPVLSEERDNVLLVHHTSSSTIAGMSRWEAFFVESVAALPVACLSLDDQFD